MRPVCLLDRTKNLYQSDRLHFISDSLMKRAVSAFLLRKGAGGSFDFFEICYNRDESLIEPISMGKIWWSRVKIFDNITNTVRDDLRAEIVRGSRVSIAAACFSMYAYQELREQLASVEEFRFLFTSPTFIREKAAKEKRQFYIPRISRETSLYGTEFEVRLRLR